METHGELMKEHCSSIRIHENNVCWWEQYKFWKINKKKHYIESDVTRSLVHPYPFHMMTYAAKLHNRPQNYAKQSGDQMCYSTSSQCTVYLYI